jgi:CheY-like chemotaxis protein
MRRYRPAPCPDGEVFECRPAAGPVRSGRYSPGRVNQPTRCRTADPLPAGPAGSAESTRRCAAVAVVRVLVVDDQAAFLRTMTSVVRETPGFEVVGEASSGEESLVVATDLLPDLVLMDVHLPGIDGLEATRRLLGRDRPPVVLLLSTYDEDAGADFVAESGASAYLTKSAFGPDRLREAWSAAAR